MRRGLRWAVWSLLLLPLLWAGVWEPSRLLVRETDLAPTQWPTALDGLKIAQLSDLHVGAPWVGLDQLRRVVERCNAQSPDLVLLTGDYIAHVLGGTILPPEDIAQVLEGLKAPLGVYAVLGNHDWFFDGPRVHQALAAAGIPVLEDRAVALEHRGTRFWLIGIGDYNETTHDWRTPLATVPEGEPVIAFTHSPDVFPELPARVALTLAGHTHGGQVRLPFFGALRVPSKYGSRYDLGVFEEAGHTLFVSPGIGTSILPLRLGVPPQISLLRLRSSAMPSQSASRPSSAAP